MWQKISIIIPVYNEAESIEGFLQGLQVFCQYGRARQLHLGATLELYE